MSRGHVSEAGFMHILLLRYSSSSVPPCCSTVLTVYCSVYSTHGWFMSTHLFACITIGTGGINGVHVCTMSTHHGTSPWIDVPASDLVLWGDLTSAPCLKFILLCITHLSCIKAMFKYERCSVNLS